MKTHILSEEDGVRIEVIEYEPDEIRAQQAAAQAATAVLRQSLLDRGLPMTDEAGLLDLIIDLVNWRLIFYEGRIHQTGGDEQLYALGEASLMEDILSMLTETDEDDESPEISARLAQQKLAKWNAAVSS